MRKITLESSLEGRLEQLENRMRQLEYCVRQLEHPAKYKEGDLVFYVRDRPRILEVDLVEFDGGWLYDLRLEKTRIYSKVREEDLLSDIRGLSSLLDLSEI